MRTRRSCIVFLGLAVFLLSVVPALAVGPAVHDIRPGSGVTETTWLSSYFPALQGTPGDTRVYVLNGKKPGPTVLILGGTHGDEISGIMSATLMVERAAVEAGRVIIIPRANNSASTYSQIGLPSKIELQTPSGLRSFAYGSRRTNPAHQGSDPATFVHYPSGITYPGEESRNLDRVHPGKADGNLTQQVAYAMFQLILKEKPEVSIDFHEAGPGSTLAYMIIGNPKCVDLAAMAAIGATSSGMSLQIERSSTQRGLSHREWGDATSTKPFIIETANPGQGSGAKGADVVNNPDNPLWYRVAVHLTVARELLAAHADLGGGSVVISNLPTVDDLKKNGLGFYLN